MVLIMIGVLLVLLMIGWSLEKFLVQKNWSNPFLNGFYIFNMIFSSPFNVLFATIMTGFIGVILALYEIDIASLLPMHTYKLPIHIDPPIVAVITFSIITIVLFIIIAVFSGLMLYIIWTDSKRIKESYQGLLEYSKKFTFRMPLLMATLGLCLPELGSGSITSFSYKIMLHGLYMVPLFMMLIGKIRLWKK